MQHFMIPCDFGGRKAPFPIYVGEPKSDAHPLQHQSTWLSSERGGSIPQEVMDSFEKLHKISMDNNVSFEELCVYAMGEALGDDKVPEQGTAPDAPPPPLEEIEAPQQQASPQEIPSQPEHVEPQQPPAPPQSVETPNSGTQAAPLHQAEPAAPSAPAPMQPAATQPPHEAQPVPMPPAPNPAAGVTPHADQHRPQESHQQRVEQNEQTPNDPQRHNQN